MWAGEIAHGKGASAKPDDPILIPSTHMIEAEERLKKKSLSYIHVFGKGFGENLREAYNMGGSGVSSL